MADWPLFFFWFVCLVLHKSLSSGKDDSLCLIYNGNKCLVGCLRRRDGSRIHSPTALDTMMEWTPHLGEATVARGGSMKMELRELFCFFLRGSLVFFQPRSYFALSCSSETSAGDKKYSLKLVPCWVKTGAIESLRSKEAHHRAFI